MITLQWVLGTLVFMSSCILPCGIFRDTAIWQLLENLVPRGKSPSSPSPRVCVVELGLEVPRSWGLY